MDYREPSILTLRRAPCSRSSLGIAYALDSQLSRQPPAPRYSHSCRRSAIFPKLPVSMRRAAWSAFRPSWMCRSRIACGRFSTAATSAVWRGSASWGWYLWFIRPPFTRRFEHSLGVYRLALLYLKQLSHDERFVEAIRPADAEVFIAAALLHDLGHWPFCHPIEDIDLPGVPSHELFANSFLLEGEIADMLRTDWKINPRDVVSLLSDKPRDPKSRILQSMLSGPIDIDKMDYLARDSLHAGVPYGRHFDQGRLLGSLCLNDGRRWAGDYGERAHRRRDDGLCPLRDV